MVSSIGHINQSHLYSGQLTDEEWPRLTETVERLRGTNLHIDQTLDLTYSELHAKVRRLARQCGRLGLIVVDCEQWMGVYTHERDETIWHHLKTLAKERQCPVISLSRCQNLSNVYIFGGQAADVIIFIPDRDFDYETSSSQGRATEIIIDQQLNGPTGKVKLAFLGHLARFENLSENLASD
jgi:replicative DNA helicase